MEFKIELKHKRVLSGFLEQDLPYQCPNCNKELELKDILGFGEYPKGGFRDKLKPNKSIGVGFECPECFVKSCFHADKYVYKMYKNHLKLGLIDEK